MNIIQPYAKILDLDLLLGVSLLRKIERIGRVSHRSEDLQTIDSWKRFIQAVVLDHGDWSIVEHAGVTCEFYVDRGITHELVRHRLFSFTQESTKFVNYKKKMLPSFVDPMEGMFEPIKEAWDLAIKGCEKAYGELIDLGVSPQIARSVFPNALASKIIVTGNLRNWRHFFIMRTSKETHPQMKEVTLPLLRQFKEEIPLLFDDIIPNSRQIDNLRLPR